MFRVSVCGCVSKNYECHTFYALADSPTLPLFLKCFFFAAVISWHKFQRLIYVDVLHNFFKSFLEIVGYVLSNFELNM